MCLRSSKKIVLDVAKSAAKLGLVPYTTGNFSLRDANSRYIVITPSGILYDEMTESEIIVVDQLGEVVEGNLRASSEMGLHLSIYQNKPEVYGIVHTHSTYLTCFAALGIEIPAVVAEAAATIGSKIPLVPYETPHTKQLGISVLDGLKDSNVVLLQNHGFLAVASTLESAFKSSVMAEHIAKVYHLALLIGKPKILDEEKIKKILKRKAELGIL